MQRATAPMQLHRTYGGCHGDITSLDWSPDGRGSLWPPRTCPPGAALHRCHLCFPLHAKPLMYIGSSIGMHACSCSLQLAASTGFSFIHA